MGMKTEIIRFNVRERGRRFRGQDRNFDTAALASLINGGEVQERVKNGDLLGYYGHWPRVKFGMDVQEGAMVGGKPVHLEPAIRTTSIKAYPDGTIEHQAEFLDTAPGRLAQRLYQSKTGGFSSAINAPRRGSMQVPNGFFGFDYVLEPNFTGNRGYALDSAGNRIELDDLDEAEAEVLDAVEEYTGMVLATTAMLDRVQADYDRQAEVVLVLQEENVEYQSQIANLQAQLDSAKEQIAKGMAVPPALLPAPEPVEREPTQAEVLDDARVRGVPVSESRFAGADAFVNPRTPLADFEKGEDDRKAEKPTAADRYIARVFGVR